MVMDNIESDTDQVFYKGKNYRKVRAGLSRPLKDKAEAQASRATGDRDKANVSGF